MPKINIPPPGAPRRLARAAFMLYGPQHIEQMARLLDVDRKTVFRWRSGVTPVPAYVWEPIKVALMKRAKDIASYLEKE